MRTRQRRGGARYVTIMPVRMAPSNGIGTMGDGRIGHPFDLNAFARRDGFLDGRDFAGFSCAEHPGVDPFQASVRKPDLSAAIRARICKDGSGPSLLRLSERRLGIRRGDFDGRLRTCEVGAERVEGRAPPRRGAPRLPATPASRPAIWLSTAWTTRGSTLIDRSLPRTLAIASPRLGAVFLLYRLYKACSLGREQWLKRSRRMHNH